MSIFKKNMMMVMVGLTLTSYGADLAFGMDKAYDRKKSTELDIIGEEKKSIQVFENGLSGIEKEERKKKYIHDTFVDSSALNENGDSFVDRTLALHILENYFQQLDGSLISKGFHAMTNERNCFERAFQNALKIIYNRDSDTFKMVDLPFAQSLLGSYVKYLNEKDKGNKTKKARISTNIILSMISRYGDHWEQYNGEQDDDYDNRVSLYNQGLFERKNKFVLETLGDLLPLVRLIDLEKVLDKTEEYSLDDKVRNKVRSIWNDMPRHS